MHVEAARAAHKAAPCLHCALLSYGCCMWFAVCMRRLVRIDYGRLHPILLSYLRFIHPLQQEAVYRDACTLELHRRIQIGAYRGVYAYGSFGCAVCMKPLPGDDGCLRLSGFLGGPASTMHRWGAENHSEQLWHWV
jgi:hypothetical protein